MTTIAQLEAAGLNLVIPNSPLTEPLAAPATLTPDGLTQFPEELYNLTQDSHLFALLVSLVGDAGAGQLVKQMLPTKLAQMLDSTNFQDLDLLYGNAFGLPRLVSETYAYNPTNDLLTQEQWQEVKAKDASYRSRCLLWMRAIKLGATVQGMALAAQAALGGIECNVVEHYAYLDNLSSDMPVNVCWTDSFEQGGFYNPAVPTFYAWQYQQSGAALPPIITSAVNDGSIPFDGLIWNAADQSNYLAASSTGATLDGVTITTGNFIRVNPLETYALSAYWRRANFPTNGVGDPKSVMSVLCFNEANTQLGIAYPTIAVPGVTNTPLTSGFVNPNAGVPLPAWQRWGGVFPTFPAGTVKVKIQIVVYGPGSTVGTVNLDAVQFEDSGQITLYGSRVVGLTHSSNEAVIIPQVPDLTDEEEQAITQVVDRLSPADCFVTIQSGDRIRIEKPAIDIEASSSNFVVQYMVTGQTSLDWPDVDPTRGYWIEPAIANEAPVQAFQDAQEVAAFVAIQTVTASSEAIGYFNGTQQSLFPQLAASVTAPLEVHSADQAIAVNYIPPVVTGSWFNRNLPTTSTQIAPIVNGSYPLDYFALIE